MDEECLTPSRVAEEMVDAWDDVECGVGVFKVIAAACSLHRGELLRIDCVDVCSLTLTHEGARGSHDRDFANGGDRLDRDEIDRLHLVGENGDAELLDRFVAFFSGGYFIRVSRKAKKRVMPLRVSSHCCCL